MKRPKKAGLRVSRAKWAATPTTPATNETFTLVRSRKAAHGGLLRTENKYEMQNSLSLEAAEVINRAVSKIQKVAVGAESLRSKVPLYEAMMGIMHSMLDKN